MTAMPRLTRRHLLLAAGAGALLPRAAIAASYREVTWYDLIPPGVPMGQIIGEGVMDEARDFWNPVFDENGSKLNPELDGARIKMPGFVIPFDTTSEGVTSFVLVPFVGACIHVPPPPPNQLVFVTTEKPWPSTSLWDPVWVSGTMSATPKSTQLADIGYQMTAEVIELYVY
ncbi:DUF3299 domain-containing protein [Roseovarius aquimarinus]|uniref:DUF3299 domain-containing protein n=1 Tax=Roseovarius aquimarinus TaxID=1229156 RepID=A0ABW7I4F3_9RHOB